MTNQNQNMESELRAAALGQLTSKLQKIKKKIDESGELSPADKTTLDRSITAFKTLTVTAGRAENLLDQLQAALLAKESVKRIAKLLEQCIAQMQQTSDSTRGINAGSEMQIPIERVRPGKKIANDRKDFDPVALRELADSIKENGQVEPYIVRPVIPPEDGKEFEIAAGERRYRAQLLNGSKFILAIVRNLNDEQASSQMLVENTGREDLNPIEEGAAYKTRRDTFGWSDAKIAKVAGVSETLVQQRVSLLSLIPEAQKLIVSGDLPVGHGEAMTNLDHNRQRIILKVLNESKGMTLKTFIQVAHSLEEDQAAQSLFDLEEFWVKKMKNRGAAPRKGNLAYTGAPTRKDLPHLSYSMKDGLPTVFEKYIVLLQQSGLPSEAGTIGTLYTFLVKNNYLAVPEQSLLTGE